MNQTKKKLGKYEVAPSFDHLKAVVDYFREHAKEDGTVTFTQSQMMESPIVTNSFKSPSYLNGVCTYLSNEGYIEKIGMGSRRSYSHWNVKKLLDHWEEVETREILGTSRPQRDENGNKIYLEGFEPANKAEIEVIRTEETKVEEPVASVISTKEVVAPAPSAIPVAASNPQIMSELKSTIEDMMGYLQTLPIEMSTHLYSISNKLELADENALKNLQEKNTTLESSLSDLEQKNKDLQEEVLRLKTELENAPSTPNYNTHHVYRQRNAILDEVDRMIAGPSWAIRQNGPHIRKVIETKLDVIMAEIGAIEKTEEEETN